jgi:hypothetical protein
MPDISKLSMAELRELEGKIAALRMSRLRAELNRTLIDYGFNPKQVATWDQSGRVVTIALA